MLQVQVNERAGITYTTGLKGILRHDPDIIMVGEIRDSEILPKLLSSTYRTLGFDNDAYCFKDTKGSLYRLLEFGVSFQEMEQTCSSSCTAPCRNSLSAVFRKMPPACKNEKASSVQHIRIALWQAWSLVQ